MSKKLSLLTFIFAALLLSGCKTLPARSPAPQAFIQEPTCIPTYTPGPYPSSQEGAAAPTNVDGCIPYTAPQDEAIGPTYTPYEPGTNPNGMGTHTPAPPPTSMPYPYPPPPGQPLPLPESTRLPPPAWTPTSTPTAYLTRPPASPGESGWYTYTASGVSIQYPGVWQVRQINSPEYVFFGPDPATTASPYEGVLLEILAHQGEDVPDPHSWQPNEGGYAIQWERPISIGDLPGIEFVWGAYRGDGTWDSLPTLNAWLYYAPRKLDIRLSAAFDSPTIDRALAEGYQPVIDEVFTVFHHMLESIRVSP